MPTPLRDLVETSDAVRAAAGRLEKRALLSAFFAGLAPEDLRLAASYLAGEIPQGSLGVGWRALETALRPGDQGVLSLFDAAPLDATLRDADQAFEDLKKISGRNTASRRSAVLARLMARSSEQERHFLRALLTGELRQGALRALVIEALAHARGLAPDDLRRAVMRGGSFDEVVGAVAREGASALDTFHIKPFVPVEPMLAGTAAGLDEALADLEAVAVEWKLDGVRVQLHRLGADVRIFTRQLRDVTALLPEIAAIGRSFSASSFILDGEVIALGSDGRPIPFQDLMSLVSQEGKPKADHPPLTALFFDLLYLNGDVLIDRPYRDRREQLDRTVPETHRVRQRVVRSIEEAAAIFDEALAAGHEGVLVKNLDTHYMAGRRGSHWRKVKPAVTLDLVILAAEWGHGRRRGFLSNLHLGARVSEKPGTFLMLGKTFKGLTDVMLREMTADLLALETHREDHVVFVRPERVVEIAFDAVQRSPRYDSGLALRFARVKRFRPDKSVEEASTIDEVRRIYAGPASAG